MKNLLLFCLAVFGMTSCSKDSLDQNTNAIVQPNKSEIMVSVTYLHWTDQCEFSCGNSGTETLSSIANAKVELYSGEQNETDALGTPLLNIKTNTEGAALIEYLEPAAYTVWVDTPLGKKSRTITTQLHRRSYIDFSF
ncbi:MAG: hypothetical protein ABJB16_02965 [Saprospiraceae bacterium]